MLAPGARLHFLDGLRGWAAVAVLFSHLFQMWLFTYVGTGTIRSWISPTPLRLLMDGKLCGLTSFHY
jgi:peptidoglycan/LPS O-acetylase OafA/YrhL